jgi:hypothetical protein
MSITMLATGPLGFRNGDAVRAGLRAMLDRYGYDGSRLVVLTREAGVGAIAARAWAELPGVDPEVTVFQPLMPYGDPINHGPRIARMAITDAGVRAVLVFAPKQGGHGRVMWQEARNAGIPAWRWSISARRLVEPGVDIHGGRRMRGHGYHDPAYDR